MHERIEQHKYADTQKRRPSQSDVFCHIPASATKNFLTIIVLYTTAEEPSLAANKTPLPS